METETTNCNSLRSTVGGSVTLLEQAQKLYAELTKSLTEVQVAANVLFDDNSDSSSQMRAMLLGQSSASHATYKELWMARMQYEVDLSKVDFLMGKLVQPIKINLGNPPDVASVIKQLSASLDVILRLRHPLQRDMFMLGEQGINKTVVRALHNIGKNKKKSVEFEKIVMDYDTRIKVIDKCVQKSLQRQKDSPSRRKKNKVTEDDALWARKCVILDHMVEDPSGKDGTRVDLLARCTLKAGAASCLIADIGSHLADLMQHGFLDVQTGVTTASELSANERGKDPRKPTVTCHHIQPTVDPDRRSFQVCVIKNPISEAFMEKYMAVLDTLLFTKGRGGKQRAKIRNASSTEEPASIVIAGKYVYGGLPVSEIEAQILEMANLIANYQRKVIEEKYCKDGYLVTFHCNLLHTVIAAINDALYSAHSDNSALLCSSDDENYCHVQDDLWLPTREELQIMTLVLSNSPEEYSTELIYTERKGELSTAADAVELCRVPLGSCCLHFQGPGSQVPGIFHEVKTSPCSSADGSIWRCISTMRFTLDPKKSPDEVNLRIKQDLNFGTLPKTITDYNITGVVSACSSYTAEASVSKELVGNSNAFEEENLEEAFMSSSVSNEGTHLDNEDTLPFFDLSSKEYTDLYPIIEPEAYDSMGLYQPGPTVRLGGTMTDEFSAGPTLKILFERGYLVELMPESNSPNQQAIPLLHEIRSKSRSGKAFPQPGVHYDLSKIAADAGLKHNDRSHPIICRHQNSQRIIILSQSYKNQAAEIKRYLRKVDRWWKNADTNSPFFTDDFDGIITLHGSGGSPEIPGTYAPSPNYASKDDPKVVLPLHQPILDSKVNMAFLEMAKLNEVVTIYVNEALFIGASPEVTNPNRLRRNTGPDKRQKVASASNQNDRNMVRCLGTFFCNGFKLTSSTEEEVIAEHGKDTLERQKFCRHKLVPHVEASFAPFMSNNDLSNMRKHSINNYRDGFKMVRIPYMCPDYIEMEIGIGDATMAASLHPSKRVMRSSVVADFIDKGNLRKYTSEVDRERCDMDDAEDEDDSECCNQEDSEGKDESETEADVIRARASIPTRKRHRGDSSAVNDDDQEDAEDDDRSWCNQDKSEEEEDSETEADVIRARASVFKRKRFLVDNSAINDEDQEDVEDDDSELCHQKESEEDDDSLAFIQRCKRLRVDSSAINDDGQEDEEEEEDSGWRNQEDSEEEDDSETKAAIKDDDQEDTEDEDRSWCNHDKSEEEDDSETEADVIRARASDEEDNGDSYKEEDSKEGCNQDDSKETEDDNHINNDVSNYSNHDLDYNDYDDGDGDHEGNRDHTYSKHDHEDNNYNDGDGDHKGDKDHTYSNHDHEDNNYNDGDGDKEGDIDHNYSNVEHDDNDYDDSDGDHKGDKDHNYSNHDHEDNNYDNGDGDHEGDNKYLFRKMKTRQVGAKCMSDLWIECEGNCHCCKKLFVHCDKSVTIGMSSIAGKGLFATKAIPAGRLVIEYTGTLINRVQMEGIARTSYVAKLGNKFIDARKTKSPHKYINHSCTPNCKLVRWTDRGSVERMSIVSATCLQQGDELTIHYGDEHHHMFDKCLCLSCVSKSGHVSKGRRHKHWSTRVKMEATMPDIFSAVLMNSYCGALRYSKSECLTTKKGTTYATPLKDASLPGLFRKHPTPMSNRALDVVTLGQRRVAYEDGMFERCNTVRSRRIKSGTDLNREDLLNTLFKATVIRFTGRLNPFKQYSIEKNKVSMLPSLNDVDDFLAFMESTIPSTTRSLGQWLSKQHEKSIPLSTKNYDGFTIFIKAVCRRLSGTLTTMLQGGTRAAAVKALTSMLLACCSNDTSGQLTFMSQVIVADVEELFDDPFGLVTSEGVVAGQGGTQGHVMLKNAGGAKDLKDALDDIISYVLKVASPAKLLIAGYVKDVSTGSVINMINGRPFNASDAEHFLCKVWMIAKYTLANNDSRYPRPTTPHCHPVKLARDNSLPQQDVEEVMRRIIMAYQSEKSSLNIPEFCLLRNEKLTTTTD